MTFKLTYSTMFSAPEEMHERFEAALFWSNASVRPDSIYCPA